MTCTECHELRRSFITLANEARGLAQRTRSRHPSPPERRRLHRLRSEAHLARQELENHRTICREATQ